MTPMMRTKTRAIKIQTHINPYALGSCLVEFGATKVHITATCEDSVPPFLKGKGSGWLTAEYAMLPSATQTRNSRERKSLSGRTQEIQRLIGRSLRSVLDLNILGARSITIDCDVLVADGGTRTAAITGGFVALWWAIEQMLAKGIIEKNPIREALAAVSVGLSIEDEILADLNYDEDSQCATDVNIVMTESGKYVEIQGTAERGAFSPEQLQGLLKCGQVALEHIFNMQKVALKK